jgi:hypothetical protein
MVLFTNTASLCSKVYATAAFLWIGWAIWLFVLFTLVYIIGASRGDSKVSAWRIIQPTDMNVMLTKLTHPSCVGLARTPPDVRPEGSESWLCTDL